MKSIYLKYLLLSVIAALFLSLVYNIYTKRELKNKTTHSNRIKKLIEFTDIDSKSYRFNNLNNFKPIIVIYFNTGCESCQHELSQIKSNREEFNNVNIFCFSTEEPAVIKKYVMSLDLYGYSNIYFASISEDIMLANLGDLGVPHILIYNSNLVLQKEFKGETRIQSLLKFSK